MNIDLLNMDIRKAVIDDINSWENKTRKAESLSDYEIYNGRIYKYVYDQLVAQLSENTAKQVPIVSNINLAERITNNEATIYNNDPRRTFSIDNTTIADADVEAFESIYEDFHLNSKLQKANKYFKLRKQAFIQVVPKDSGIDLRVLQAHHIDVIPDENDPEKAYAYIVSAFDKTQFLQGDGNQERGDGQNEKIADADDYKAALQRYVVWTAEYNYVMDGKGNIVGEVIPNAIQELPFVDISKDKDFEFFVRQGHSLTDFTIQYNLFWSDFFYIARMQGFSLGVFSGDPELMPKQFFVGPNRCLVLPTNPANPDQKVDFKFVSPSPDLNGILQGISALLASYLTSKGVSPKTVSTQLNGAEHYSSGIERLLAMIDRFESTKEDFDLFRSVEDKVFNIIKKYQVALSRTEFLDREYWVSESAINTELDVLFHRPEMVQTESEKLANIKTKIEMGISDKALAIAELEETDIDTAEQKIVDMYQRKLQFLQILGAGADKSTSFTGPQIASIVDIVTKIASGEIPRDSGVAIVQAALDVDTTTAENIISSAGAGFKATVPAKPSQGGFSPMNKVNETKTQ